MPAELVPLAKIGAAQGIKGEVRVKPYGDPELLAGYKSLQDVNGRPMVIASVRFQKGLLITRFEGIDDRNAAESLNGVELFADRSELAEPDEDEFYISDLIGMQVVDQNGAEFGKIRAVPNYGAGDIIEIMPVSGGESLLYPFTREIFPEIDMEGEKLTIVPPTETFDRDEQE